MSNDFEYTLDKSKAEYLNNWYVKMDLVCTGDLEIDQFMSTYFVGFGLGIFLFSLPDMFGKKRTMSVLMTFFILASYLSVFGETLKVKGLGLFL